MTTTEEDRELLHQRLVEVLGQGPADTLMDLLTPHRIDVDAYREQLGELGAALVSVGVTSQRARRELSDRDISIRAAHSAGASVAELVQTSLLDRAAVADILDKKVPA